MTLGNMEIMGIVNSYTTQKESIRKAREKGKEIQELKLPAAVAWKRRLNMDALFKAKQVIDDAVREIQQKYSSDEYSEQGDGDTRKVKPEYLKDFAKEQADVLTQETDVNIRTIHPEELEGLTLSDEDMDTSAFMISEERG